MILRSYTGSLKCKISQSILDEIIDSESGYMREHRTKDELVCQITKDFEYLISEDITIYFFKNDLIFKD